MPEVPAGHLCRIGTIEGPQVGNLNLWNRHDPRERMWTARTQQRTGTDWLTWLADRSRENEVFRHDLIRYNPQQRHTQAEALAEAACRLVTSASPEEFLAVREQQQPPPRRVCTRGVFGPPAAVRA